MNVIFAGDFNGEDFAVRADADEVSRLLTLIMEGRDDMFHRKLADQPEMVRRCVDAMAYEDDIFINNMMSMLESEQFRFGIFHGHLVFGAGSDHVQAATAFVNKEF